MFKEAGKGFPTTPKGKGPGSDYSKIKKYLTQRWNALNRAAKNLKGML